MFQRYTPRKLGFDVNGRHQRLVAVIRRTLAPNHPFHIALDGHVHGNHQRWLTIAEWVFRWIIVPGKLIVCAVATCQWGWHLPLRKVLRVMLGWRWWLAVIICSLIAVAWPSTFFAGIPHGSVSHQVWAVALKLVATFIFAIGAWLNLLAWAAALLSSDNPTSDPGELVPVPALVSPPDDNQRGADHLPLPEGGSDRIGDA